MENDYYDLDKWKTFVLRVLLEKNGSSLTDYVWNRLKHEFSLGENEQTEHNLYTESVLKCFEVEHGLIRTNKRGIQITTKGEEVAKKLVLTGINIEYMDGSTMRINKNELKYIR